MKTNWYINNYSFRIASPILVGIIAYLLILIFFDSVSDLSNNFFSREVLFTILLTLVVFEFNRLLIVILNRKIPVVNNLKKRSLIQVLLSILLTITIVSTLLYFYFIQFVGFTTITTEVITFNTIYILIISLYNMYFFSIVYMRKRDEALVKTEISKRTSVELELKAISNYVNPDFLFSSLEIVIADLHRKGENTEKIISNLADIYRFTLDNQQNELIRLQDEIDNLNRLVDVFSHKYGDAIVTTFLKNGYDDYYLIPGTVQSLFEYAIFSNIITDEIPLTFEITVATDMLIVSYNHNEHLNRDTKSSEKLDMLNNAYSYYNDKGIRIDRDENSVNIMVPLIRVEEEE